DQKLHQHQKSSNRERHFTIAFSLLAFFNYSLRLQVTQTKFQQESARVSEEFIELARLPRVPEVLKAEDKLERARSQVDEGELEAGRLQNRIGLLTAFGTLTGFGFALLGYLRTSPEDKAKDL